MTVSVIIPAYNCEAYIGHAIESILHQTYYQVEILVADDGSVDRTRELIDAYADTRIRRYHNSENCGYLNTVNSLLARATGEYICFQDADDWSAPDRIEKQIDALARSNYEICGTGIFYTSPTGKLQKRVVYPETCEEVRTSILQGHSSACYASILFSRSVLDSVGDYRDFFSCGAEDVDWLLRVLDGYEYVNLADALYFYRFTPSSITQSTSALKLKASLSVARELALQRESGGEDSLQAGKVNLVQSRWDEIYEELGQRPLAEELLKINSLLRRSARWECLKLCAQVMRKDVRASIKLPLIASVAVKMILGMDHYSSLKSKFFGASS